jgi:hypothetical protein
MSRPRILIIRTDRKLLRYLEAFSYKYNNYRRDQGSLAVSRSLMSSERAEAKRRASLMKLNMRKRSIRIRAKIT